MRWNKKTLGLVELFITGIEENLFFRSLCLFPPTPIPGLQYSKIYVGMFSLHNKEDLEELSKLISSNINWKKDESMLQVKNFYDIHDVKALRANFFRDKFIEYKKPVNHHDIIIKVYDKDGKFIFKKTLFDVYDIFLDTTRTKVSFKYKQELQEYTED